MNKFRYFIFPALFIVLSLLIISYGLGLFSNIPVINWDEILGTDLFSDTDKNLENNDEVLKMLINDLKSQKSNVLSENTNALWFEINKDLSVNSEEGTNAVKYAIYSDFLYFRNFVPNTMFIKPDIENEFLQLKEEDGSQFDVLAYLLYYCRDIGCDAILIADEDMIYDSEGNITDSAVNKYLSEYDFKGLLLSDDNSYSEESYFTNAEFFSSFMSDNFSDLLFGVEIHSDFEKMFADDYVISVFENKLVDFGYVDCMTATGDSEYPFFSVALWWNSFADYYGVPFICEHRADKIFTNDIWGYSNEINLQLKALYNCPAFYGSCFYSTTSIKSKKALERDLSIFLNDVSATEQDTFEVETLEIKNDEVIFTGSIISDSYNLYCNGIRILTNEGKFTEDFPLIAGLNEFNFFSNGGKYTYDVYNNVDLIYSFYPETDISLDSSKTFYPYAVCPVDSIVYVMYDGKAYQLQKSEQSGISDVPVGYSVFSGNLTVSLPTVKLEDISFLCSYNGIFEIINGGVRISDNSEINSADSVSPYKDNGLGFSLMCKLKNDNTEQISEVDDYDTYHPYNSSLLAGTFDYVENINVSPEGYLRYELKSGINVYGTDAVLINNAYSMPTNNVHFLSIDNTTDKTVLTFSKDWLSPITVTTEKIDYKTGYQQFSFNIENFTMNYVDITFYYTDSIIFDSILTFGENSVFSSYELISGFDKTVLRLYLKNKQAFFGYDLIERENGNVEISFKNNLFTGINGKVIMLDPGHGGISMVGTALQDNSVSESQITLAIALKTKQYLESYGAKVIMTRTSDIGLTLYERTVMCENADPDIFVSIHCDGTGSTAESGTHTFYFTPYSQPLAQSIHNSIVNAYLTKIYTEADENYSKVDRKIKYYPFYVTRVDNCPSVLVETGFLTNLTEGYVLTNPDNQDIIASAIANGIYYYFSKQ